MNAENDTSDAEKECEDRPINQGDASAVLVSITKTDHHKYKYEFKYEPTANTAAANTLTTSESEERKCKEIKEDDMNSQRMFTVQKSLRGVCVSSHSAWLKVEGVCQPLG